MRTALWILCCSLSISVVHSIPERTILNFKWKDLVLTNQSKPWKTFVDKMLESCKARSQILASLLHNIHRKIYIFFHLCTKTEIKDKFLHNCPVFNKTDFLVKPAGNIMFTVKKKVRIYCHPNYVQHKWMFDTDKSVRINLTFSSFHIKAN